MTARTGGRDPLAVLRRLIESDEWVAIDTETTGLGAKAELIELAIVQPSGEVYETLVQPSRPSGEGASRIHRIEPVLLARAPKFGEIARTVAGRLQRRRVLGYAVDFDRRILWRAFALAGLPAPVCRWTCLGSLVTRWCGRRLSLDGALALVGLEPERPRHRAAPDARSVVALARALASR